MTYYNIGKSWIGLYFANQFEIFVERNFVKGLYNNWAGEIVF